MSIQPSTKQGFYDSIYFESDEEDTGDESSVAIARNDEKSPGMGLIGRSKAPSAKQDKHKIPANDELLYDPGLDDRDEAWVAQQIARSNPEKSSQPAKTDGILACPMCFTMLCLDCQRHEKYHHQYRAMFVQSCRIDRAKRYHYNAAATKQKNKIQEEGDEEYYAVRCTECDTQVAMLDQDEVYHFFNVLAS